MTFHFFLALALAQAGQPVRPLAQDYVTLFESPEPANVFCYTPGLARLASGRLVATWDLGGPGVAKIDGPKVLQATEKGQWLGKIATSDDQGKTWTPRGDYPFTHARPFQAGKSVYVLGHDTDLVLFRSDDDAVTWKGPFKLTRDQLWHQSACNVHYANGCVYLVMERRVSSQAKGWYVSELAPVLMRAKLDADLTKRESWTFADELPFIKALGKGEADWDTEYFGVPFLKAPFPTGSLPALKRSCAPMGWLETNVVQFTDPDHVWHDPKGKTFHLWMRAHTGGTGYAAIAKVIENGDGSMQTSLESAPSGKKMLYVPCPGGQMRFHVLYDDVTKLYWLLSSQATDSMIRVDRLPANRFSLPNNERHRLQLHFSRNMVDWCFAGLVAVGKTPQQARHYASMAIVGEDLCIVSRSGDDRAKDAHNGNLVTFHTVRDFRKLVY